MLTAETGHALTRNSPSGKRMDRYFMRRHCQAGRQSAGIGRTCRQTMDGNGVHGCGPPAAGGLPSIW